MSLRLLCVFSLALSACSLAARATTITYTLEDTASEGTLGTDSLLSISYTMTAIADTSQITVTPISSGNLFVVPSESTTISISGEISPVFNGLGVGYTPFSADLTVTIPTEVVYNSASGIVGVASGDPAPTFPNVFPMPAAALSGWDFATSIGPVTAESEIFTFASADTDQGHLETAPNAPAVFQAQTTDASVPEPHSVLLTGLGLALLGLLTWTRTHPRRRAP